MTRLRYIHLLLTVALMGACLPDDSSATVGDPDAGDSTNTDVDDDASSIVPDTTDDDSVDDDANASVVPDASDDSDSWADTSDTSTVNWPDCAPNGASVIAAIFLDDRSDTRADTGFVMINSGSNPEASLSCDATVTLIVDGEETVFEETQPGQYEAGYSAIAPGLPDLTLYEGLVHVLEIDLDSNGTVEITGEVTMSDISDFEVDASVPGEVTFSWDDYGVVADTAYSVQASNESDFTFADYFATGYIEAETTIQFGGDSEWRYFNYGGTVHARIQSDTTGTLSSNGRFNAWQWPAEPLLSF